MEVCIFYIFNLLIYRKSGECTPVRHCILDVCTVRTSIYVYNYSFVRHLYEDFSAWVYSALRYIYYMYIFIACMEGIYVILYSFIICMSGACCLYMYVLKPFFKMKLNILGISTCCEVRHLFKDLYIIMYILLYL